MKIVHKIHFEISERKILLRVFDVLFVLLLMYCVSFALSFDYFTITCTNFYWTFVLAFYINVIGAVFDMYNLQVASSKFLILKSTILTASMTTILFLLTPYFTPVLPHNRIQILTFFLCIVCGLLLWRFFYILFLASNRFVKRVIFIGNSKKMHRYINELTKVNPHYLVVGFVATDSKCMPTEIKKITVELLESQIRLYNINEIIITDDINKLNSTNLYTELLECLKNGVNIRQYADVYEQITNRLYLKSGNQELITFFPFSRSNHNALYLLYSRVHDVFSSVIGLSFLAAILPFIYLFNLIANRGPLFYTQERVGKNGVPFKIYKLRSMIIDAEKEGAVFASLNDVRVTSFGKLLRKTRVDEIPQFINVLKGEMSIIGPRPERPIFVKEIAASIPLYQTRHVIKPGLTGWAQVNYPYGSNLDDSLMKLRYDLYYIKHRSLFIDISIIIKTLGTVLFAKGQ